MVAGAPSQGNGVPHPRSSGSPAHPDDQRAAGIWRSSALWRLKEWLISGGWPRRSRRREPGCPNRSASWPAFCWSGSRMRRSRSWRRSCAPARAESIPGVGPITAMALQAFAPPPGAAGTSPPGSAWCRGRPQAEVGQDIVGQRDLRRLLIIGPWRWCPRDTPRRDRRSVAGQHVGAPGCWSPWRWPTEWPAWLGRGARATTGPASASRWECRQRVRAIETRENQSLSAELPRSANLHTGPAALKVPPSPATAPDRMHGRSKKSLHLRGRP